MNKSKLQHRRKYESQIRNEHMSGTREKLLRVTGALLLERGFEDWSIPLVARRASVSAPTVYRHFPTRSALLRAWAEWLTRNRPDAPARLTEGLDRDLAGRIQTGLIFLAGIADWIGLAASLPAAEVSGLASETINRWAHAPSSASPSPAETGSWASFLD